jgi:hypothetical protein
MVTEFGSHLSVLPAVIPAFERRHAEAARHLRFGGTEAPLAEPLPPALPNAPASATLARSGPPCAKQLGQRFTASMKLERAANWREIVPSPESVGGAAGRVIGTRPR